MSPATHVWVSILVIPTKIATFAIDSRIREVRRAINVGRLVVAVAVTDDDIPAPFMFAEGLTRVRWVVEKKAATVVQDGTGPLEHVPGVHGNRIRVVLSS